jgi:nucleoside-diphosphate-sugar epimerase
MRTIVTGGAGFVGSHLVERLIARGHDVLCIERPGARRGWIEGQPVAWDDGGLGDVDHLCRLFQDADAVFHLAALTEARSEDEFYSVNTEGTSHVMEAAASVSRPPRVVFMSTLAAMGPCRGDQNLTPDTVPYPLSVYGHSKLLAEAVVHAYSDRVPATILRFPSVYGPRERAVLKLFRMVAHGFAITVGGWERELSLVYVDDAVSGLIAAATSDEAVGRTYIIAHPESVTWSQFASAVAKEVGRTPVLVSLPAAAARVAALCVEGVSRARGRAAILNRDRVRELAQRRWVCDPASAIRQIGYRPLFPVRVGVPRTAAWYREVNWL